MKDVSVYPQQVFGIEYFVRNGYWFVFLQGLSWSTSFKQNVAL